MKVNILVLLTAALPTLAANKTTIFTLPGPIKPASWFENLTVRPNGKILATRGDAPEIWQIDPANSGSGSLLVTVPEAYNLTGIAQVKPRRRGNGGHSNQQHEEEVYVFGSSHIPAPFQVAPGSAKVWLLNISASGTPTVSLLAAMPQAGFINGIAAWDAGRVLLSDTEAEAVYLMNVDTGSYSTAITGLAGINGIQTRKGSFGEGHAGHRYIYRADHLQGRLTRIPVTSNAVALGPEEVLASGTSIDDFAIKVNGNGKGKAYIAAMYDNKILEVDVPSVVGPTGEAMTPTVLADDLSGTGTGLVTVVAFGRRAVDGMCCMRRLGREG
ncbi:uncharacterized protein CTHT_0016070 [Thermochaetoides thermophila DSM 1495]|uniref:Uncharacterized protein n=1 Tax=Chaetomium thermophilum (strain DSM 1495 / CBS 144.50 / IMI 039719) TaxID=759272 RepID=G0S258_CHATD|nr:hypothetical protein CTHT_0016070 [Thermochaetoides thermophila DSM 1495]EGS23118.1 hypothetical protein CTHT_0016070 [Thermochaetoides thermophila DSM 1495]